LWFKQLLRLKGKYGNDCAYFGFFGKKRKYSVLDKSKIENTFQMKIPKWEDNLERFLAKIEHK